MNNCPETRILLQWLNGSLPAQESSEIEKHVEKCEACHAKLLNLTDDFSLQPPQNPEDILGGDTFTNEPHFRSMRERLSKNVASLKSDSPGREIEINEPDGDLKNLVRVSVAHDEIETIDANAASTHNNASIQSQTETLPLEAIRIDGFLLESHIGSGGFAHVYKAWEKELARPVAIKLLDKSRFDARNRHRFLREAKAASSVRSPHVVQVLSSGEADNGQPYIAMELIEGETLNRWIAKRAKRLDADSINQGVQLLTQVCQGVQHVHDADLIHRDIKPGNIFVDESATTAKLGDFGLIRILGEHTVTLTRTAELAGTPAYMSPEQTVSNGELDSTSDVYSLGATLYKTLTGQPPFRGSSIAILQQVNERQPLPPRQLNEHVSKDLETICLKALEKEPQRRYQSAAAMAEDLQAALDGRPIMARPVSGVEKVIRWARRNRGLAGVIALLFISLLAGTITSTALWLKSDFHAKRSDANAAKAEANAVAATTSAARSIESRMQLVQSVKKLASTQFTRKSAYLALPSKDRKEAVTLISEVYQTIIDGQTEFNSNLMRELVADIAVATEINLELKSYSLVADLLNVSLDPAEQLLVENGFQLEDRILAAKVYNQFGDLQSEFSSNRKANKEGTAIWKAEQMPDINAVDAYQKVLAYTDVECEPDSDIAFQRMYADWRMIAFELPAEGTSKEDHAAMQTAEMIAMLEQMQRLRKDNPELDANWMMLHQRMLLGLSQRHQGQESIDYRIERAGVFKDYLLALESRGEESFWYDRSIAVNDFFIGLGYLRIGNAEIARPTILEATDRMSKLAAAYPRALQFRADLAEALIVIANIDWNGQSKEAAMDRFEEALEAFELCFKTDSDEFGLRRRTGHVYDMVGTRYLALDDEASAVKCFKKGLSHIQIVLAAPYDGDMKDSDAKMVEAIKQKLNSLETDD